MPDAQLLRPRPPFSFEHALAFLRRFPPTQGDRIVVGEAALGAARVGGRTLGFRVDGAGKAEAPALRCTISAGCGAADRPTSAQVEAVLGRLGAWLGTDDDLGSFYALAQDDPAFWALAECLYGYHQVRFFSPFENTCWAILGQRTPFGVARAAKRRLMERCGGAAVVDGRTVLAFPEPDDLAGLDGQALTALVGSERKADRLLAIARAFAEAEPDVLRVMPTEVLGQWLLALPGIGPWSASFILLRGFGRADALLPFGAAQAFDRELLQAGRAVYGADLTGEGLAALAERYGPWRGWWGHYLRIAS